MDSRIAININVTTLRIQGLVILEIACARKVDLAILCDIIDSFLARSLLMLIVHLGDELIDMLGRKPSVTPGGNTKRSYKSLIRPSPQRIWVYI
jgi:hypothetical protein